MIIIETKNGHFFVNEDNVIGVRHMRDSQKAVIIKDTGLDEIDNVTSVSYFSKVEPVKWKDNSLEIVELKKKLEDAENRLSLIEIQSVFTRVHQ